MTISQRASSIYKLIKPSGGSWSDAMAQAYEEIGKAAAEEEEAEAERQLESFSKAAADAYDGSSIFTDGNDLVSEIISQALDDMADKNAKYPATSIMNRIKEAGSMEEIRTMIFWESSNRRYNNKYRDSNGRVSSEWWNMVNRLIDALGVDTGDLDYYTKMESYFI